MTCDVIFVTVRMQSYSRVGNIIKALYMEAEKNHVIVSYSKKENVALHSAFNF